MKYPRSVISNDDDCKMFREKTQPPILGNNSGNTSMEGRDIFNANQGAWNHEKDFISPLGR